MKKKKNSTSPDKMWYVKADRTRDISARVDWENPLDLNTIVQLSKHGLLKERRVHNPKAA